MNRFEASNPVAAFSGCRAAALAWETGGFAAPAKRGQAAGFTMIEAVLSVLIVGMLLVAAMTTLGAVSTSRLSLVERQRGLALAQSLLAEIVDLPYADETTPLTFGPEAGESAAGRTGFDDADDYHGWSASPLQWPDGTAVADTTGWTRAVAVVWIDPDDLATASATDTGAKRITVTVMRGQKIAATMTAIRTEGR